MSRARKPASPLRYFNSSPEVIRLVVMMYVRFPLSLRDHEGETEESTLYHIAATPQKTDGLRATDDAEVTERLSELRRFAFEMQDQPMIVGQEANMREIRMRRDSRRSWTSMPPLPRRRPFSRKISKRKAARRPRRKSHRSKPCCQLPAIPDVFAPMVLDGPINGDWFEAYVGQVLVPDLGRGEHMRTA